MVGETRQGLHEAFVSIVSLDRARTFRSRRENYPHGEFGLGPQMIALIALLSLLC
jgi:hypothetical protein